MSFEGVCHANEIFSDFFMRIIQLTDKSFKL